MANLKAKFKAALNKGKSMSKTKGDPIKDLKEIKATSKSYFTGPFAKIKAKKAIRKGEAEFSTAKKVNPITKKEKIFSYKDVFANIEPGGYNRPYLAKKTVKTKKSQEYELGDKIMESVRNPNGQYSQD